MHHSFIVGLLNLNYKENKLFSLLKNSTNCLKQTVVKIWEENLNMCNTFIIFQGHGWSRRFHLLQEVDQPTRPDLVQAEPIAPIPIEEQPDLQAGKHCRFILPSNGRDP